MDDKYYFHQTPKDLAKDLIAFVPLVEGDRILEPFTGEGAFYESFPVFCSKGWAEIIKGVDFRDVSEDYDWVITNPPFKLLEDGKETNAFWLLLNHYTQIIKKGIAFLGNDSCFSSLTPKRIEVLKMRGWCITKIIVCSVKKWRGRYFFIILERTDSKLLDFLPKNY